MRPIFKFLKDNLRWLCQSQPNFPTVWIVFIISSSPPHIAPLGRHIPIHRIYVEGKKKEKNTEEQMPNDISAGISVKIWSLRLWKSRCKTLLIFHGGLGVGDCSTHTIKGKRNNEFENVFPLQLWYWIFKGSRENLAGKHSTDCGFLHLGWSYQSQSSANNAQPASELQGNVCRSLQMPQCGTMPDLHISGKEWICSISVRLLLFPPMKLGPFESSSKIFLPSSIHSQPFRLFLLILMTLKCTMPWCLFTIKAIVSIAPTRNLN